MMSLAAIKHISRDAAIRAARYRQVPFVFEYEDLIEFKARFLAKEKFHFRLPFLGDLVPPGWKYTDREPLFVDATGNGLESEPALTWRAFFEAVRVGFGYAVVEAGQFQAYVREYERDDSAFGNENEFVDLTSAEQAEFNEVVKQESQFDASDMEHTVQRLQRQGRMPSMDEFLRAVAEEQKRVQNASGADVAIRFEGSICLFELKTERARLWVAENVAHPNYFGRALVVEHRYAKGLARGMRRSGLSLA